MPIDIKQFKEATKPLAERIKDFLVSHPDQAYSVFELIAELDGHPDQRSVALLLSVEKFSEAGGKSKTWEKYMSALGELIQRKEVSEAEVQGTTYYAYVVRKP